MKTTTDYYRCRWEFPALQYLGNSPLQAGKSHLYQLQVKDYYIPACKIVFSAVYPELENFTATGVR